MVKSATLIRKTMLSNSKFRLLKKTVENTCNTCYLCKRFGWKISLFCCLKHFFVKLNPNLRRRVNLSRFNENKKGSKVPKEIEYGILIYPINRYMHGLCRKKITRNRLKTTKNAIQRLNIHRYTRFYEAEALFQSDIFWFFSVYLLLCSSKLDKNGVWIWKADYLRRRLKYFSPTRISSCYFFKCLRGREMVYLLSLLLEAQTIGVSKFIECFTFKRLI